MPIADGADFERILADIFRKAGWRVRPRPQSGDIQADLIVCKGDQKYVVELKSASESRSDRLIPLLSQAILQAQSFVRAFSEPAAPLAVVAARQMSASVADNLKRFAERNAPGVAVGIIDAEGFYSFAGAGLEGLNARPPRHPVRRTTSPAHIPDLFSDLNQWMLKVLLGQSLPAALISVPREPIRNASQLAAIAKVSIMSAARLVNQLSSRGFLDREEEHLEVVRTEELLDRWTASNREAAKEVPAHWIIQGGDGQLVKAVRQYASRPMHNQPRCCLGLFAAADALGFGFVRGTPAHIYLERLTLGTLNGLGLSVDRSDRAPDVIVRIPSHPEAVFRAAVTSDGVPISDVLQVWLDVATHPARGREQAREIQRRALKPLFGK